MMKLRQPFMSEYSNQSLIYIKLTKEITLVPICSSGVVIW